MHAAFLQQTIVWVWLLMAVFAIGLVGVQFGVSISGRSYDFDQLSVGLLGQQAAIGSLFLALAATGHPTAALWTWRTLAFLSACMAISALLISLIAMRTPTPMRRTFDGRMSSFVATVAAASLLAVASFFVGTAPAQTSRPVDGMPTVETILNAAVLLALLLFAMLTVVFAFLFQSGVQRDGLSVEFIDGGIGGGSRMGRVPASVSYLLGMILTGSVFVTLLMHEEARISKPEPVREPVRAESSHAAQAANTTPTNAATPAPAGTPPLPAPAAAAPSATAQPASAAKPVE